MKKIVLWICTVVMTLIASACIAGAYSPYLWLTAAGGARAYSEPLAGL